MQTTRTHSARRKVIVLHKAIKSDGGPAVRKLVRYRIVEVMNAPYGNKFHIEMRTMKKRKMDYSWLSNSVSVHMHTQRYVNVFPSSVQ